MKSNNKNSLRINKFLAKWGNVSRRKAEEMIEKGDIFINNKKISRFTTFVDPKKDTVRIKKQKIHAINKSLCYLMFNKPQKVLTTSHDPKGRPTVMDYIKNHKERLFPVGRLDWDSEGLLLFTNNGDFSDKILQPRHKIPKTYLVKAKGPLKDSAIRKLLKGISTPVGYKRVDFAKVMSGKLVSNPWVKIIIYEGKKRQIRLMFDKVGSSVCRLRRTAIGRLKMNKLKSGTYIRLTEKDLEKIFQKPKELTFRSRF